MRSQINSALSVKLSRPAEYVKAIDYPVAWLNSDAFAALKMKEEDAERDVGEATEASGFARLLHALAVAAGRCAEY